MIWECPQTATAVPLKDDVLQSSTAWGVNEDGIAVGNWGDRAATWVADDTATDGYKRTDFTFGDLAGVAKDVNTQCVVVGTGDAYSDALAVSNEFDKTMGGVLVKAVYVAGSTRTAIGVQRAVRWLANVATGEVVSTTLLTKEWAAGVNSDGDVLCNYGTGSRPALFRNNAYYSLKPPKGASGAAAHALAGPASSTTYAAGSAYGQQVNSERAVAWTIK